MRKGPGQNNAMELVSGRHRESSVRLLNRTKEIMHDFTPWSSLAGGLLIGLAASFLLAFNGRVAGISGILGGLLAPVRGDRAWRVAFLVGLVLAPWLYTALRGTPPEVAVQASPLLLVGSGLLVGFATRLGSGCTSGHGVCGIARLSPRSLVATLVFMAAGFLTVFFTRHVLGV